jgi:tetratricopeptide (TPR) repeat protein
MNSSERKALHLLVAEYLFQKIEDCKHTHVLLNVLNVIKNHYLYAEHIDKALHILGCYVQQAYLERNYDAALSGIREFRELSNGKFPYAEQQLAIKEVKIQQILGNFSQSYLELTHIQKKYLPSGTENWIEYLKAYALFNSGKTNEAKQIADELVKKLDTKLIQDEYLLLKLDILLAGMYHHFGNVAYAAKRYEQGIAISARNVGYEKEYNYLLSISNMFLADELAILQITKSMKYFNEKHLMVSYAKCANNIAISYIYLGEYKKATALLEESIHIFSDMCSISVHYPITNLGTVYALMNQYDIALDYFIQARNNPVEDFSILWITINMSHCKRKLGDFDACKVLLDEVQQKINKMTTNTALLERNLHIARTLLYLDKEDYSAAYDDCQQALEIEVNVLHNDTYPIYITKLLINIIEQLALPLPSVAEPYKCGRESEYCKDLLKSGAHWGNFLFWEM